MEKSAPILDPQRLVEEESVGNLLGSISATSRGKRKESGDSRGFLIYGKYCDVMRHEASHSVGRAVVSGTLFPFLSPLGP